MSVFEYIVTLGAGPDSIRINTTAYNAWDAAVQALYQCSFELGDETPAPPISKIEPVVTVNNLDSAIWKAIIEAATGRKPKHYSKKKK